MLEATAVLQQRGGFFKKLGKIPGANILIPLLSACVINTFFPQAFALGSFTTAMTTNGSGALAVAFLLIVGTTISFKSAPQAAFRGTVIIVTKVVFCVALAMVVQFALGDNLLGLSSMVILAACSGANNSLYAGLMGDYGTEVERGAVAITTLVVGPPDTMIALGAAGQAPLGWSLLGTVLPIIVGIILGNAFPSLKKTLSAALPGIIMIVFFAMGSTMTLGQIADAGLPGILLGVICSVGGAIINVCADRLTGVRAPTWQPPQPWRRSTPRSSAAPSLLPQVHKARLAPMAWDRVREFSRVRSLSSPQGPQARGK